MTPLETAIVRAVVYAGLFDYPLTLRQLHETLIGVPATPDDVARTCASSAAVRRVVATRDGMFFPAGRSELVAERRIREERARRFLAHHRILLQLLCTIPFVRTVALSGSIAHLNLEEGGDLDLFVIAHGRRVWTVTVALIVLTRALRARRITCANFVISDARLALDQTDLFTASQVVHLKPLVGETTLHRFFDANPFVARTYPNATQRPFEFSLGRRRVFSLLKRGIEAVLMPFAPAIEWVCRRAYTWHLRRRASSWRSPDQVRLGDEMLKLHTQSHRHSVNERFERAVDEALQTAAAREEPRRRFAAAAGRR